MLTMEEAAQRAVKLLRIAEIAARIPGERSQKLADRNLRSLGSTMSAIAQKAEIIRNEAESKRSGLGQVGVDIETNLLRSFVSMYRDGLKFEWILADGEVVKEEHLEVVVDPFIILDEKRMIRVPYPKTIVQWFPTKGASDAFKFYPEDKIEWQHGHAGQYHAHIYGANYSTPNGFCAGQAAMWIGSSHPEGRLYDCFRAILDALKDPKMTGLHDCINDPRLESFCKKCDKWSKNIVFNQNEIPRVAPSCCWVRINNGTVYPIADTFEYKGMRCHKSEGVVIDDLPMVRKSDCVLIGGKLYHPFKVKTCCISGIQIGLVKRGGRITQYNHGIQLPDGRFVSAACLDVIEEELRQKEMADAAESTANAVRPGNKSVRPVAGWSRFIKHVPGNFGFGIEHYDRLARESLKPRPRVKPVKQPEPNRAGRVATASKGRAAKVQAKAGTA